MKVTLSNFKRSMALKAKKDGICENFGEREIRKLKDTYGYCPFGNSKERQIAREIDELENWCMCFDYSMLSLY